MTPRRTCDGQRRAVGAAVGRAARRLGAERGPAASRSTRRRSSVSGSSRASACSTSAAASGASCASSRTAAPSRSASTPPRRCSSSPGRRVPEADLRVGDMESLPYDDDTFDLVTGFTSFFFANDMVAALREAGRVAKPGGPGRDPGLGRARTLRPRGDEGDRPAVLPASASRRAARSRLSEPGVLEALAAQAGLTPEETFTTSWAYLFPDEETSRAR